MNTDKLIIKIFFKENVKDISHFQGYLYKKFINGDYQNIKNYLSVRYSDSESFKETIYRIRLNIDKRPVCKNCGITLKPHFHFKHLFAECCSYKCSNGLDEKKRQYEEHCMLKYGVTTYAKTKDYLIKSRTTMKERYGVDAILKSEFFKNKRDDTLKAHKYFSKSNEEELTYKMIIKKYPNAVRNYKSDKYPFKCDIYIPSIDLYIECNYFWTHGGHLFDENNTDDVDKLNRWKQKNTKFYDNAIKTWTYYDPLKYKTAMVNKLNYKIFWNIKEAELWLQ